MKKFIPLLNILFTIVLIGACLNARAYSAEEKTLYERIGGKPVLTIVVSETVDEVIANPKTKRSFADTKISTLKASITNQFCVITGGDCIYEGESMKKSHADLKISTAEFELLVQALRDALNRHVNTREKNELLKLLAPMKHDVVTN
ncbi:MAG: group 1 truncated hemoglobin [Methylophilaceae bacterium]|nr:group 1 truncated hemoglobin [Methylophilaceae bacterium]